MYDPTMRVLTVLEMLQSAPSVTGAELAARLEVHPRTAQRYIARLQDLGVPIEGRRGAAGAYRLKAGFRVPPLMFTDDEALALLLGLRALRDLGLSAFAPATASASAKLRRALPTQLEGRVEAIQAVLELDTPWMVEAKAELVISLAAAVQGQRVVQLEYADSNARVTQRDVEPYAVLRDDGRWYVIGWCRLRRGLRCLRVDRIGALETLAERFTPPVDFDGRAYLRDSLTSAPALHHTEVWVGLPLQAVTEGLPLFRPVLTTDGDGTRVRCGVESLESFAAALLMLECKVVIHEPPELRSAFERLGQRAAQIARD